MERDEAAPLGADRVHREQDTAGDGHAAALGLRTGEVRAVAGVRARIDAEGRIRTPPGHPGVDAPLAIELYVWPPELHDETLDRLEAAGDPGYAARLSEAYAARGIDGEAIARDDRSWYLEALANTGAVGLSAALIVPASASARDRRSRGGRSRRSTRGASRTEAHALGARSTICVISAGVPRRIGGPEWPVPRLT